MSPVSAVGTVADGGTLLSPSVTSRLIGTVAEHLAIDPSVRIASSASQKAKRLIKAGEPDIGH